MDNAFAKTAAAAERLPEADTGRGPSHQSHAPSGGSHATAHAFGLHPEDRSAKHASGANAKPTKGSLKDRQGSPSGAGYTTSGIDAAMQRLADQTHRRVFKGRK